MSNEGKFLSEYENTKSEKDDSKNNIEIFEPHCVAVDKLCGVGCKRTDNEERYAKSQRVG